MDTFSLEEDDCSDLFITQILRENLMSVVYSSDDVFHDGVNDNQSNQMDSAPTYEDISDVEDNDTSFNVTNFK